MRWYLWTLVSRSPEEVLLGLGLLAMIAWGIYWIRHAD